MKIAQTPWLTQGDEGDFISKDCRGFWHTKGWILCRWTLAEIFDLPMTAKRIRLVAHNRPSKDRQLMVVEYAPDTEDPMGGLPWIKITCPELDRDFDAFYTVAMYRLKDLRDTLEGRNIYVECEYECEYEDGSDWL